jgi:hypothetical protein
MDELRTGCRYIRIRFFAICQKMFKPYSHLIFAVFFVMESQLQLQKEHHPNQLRHISWVGYRILPSHQASTDCDTRPYFGHWQQIYLSIFHDILQFNFCLQQNQNYSYKNIRSKNYGKLCDHPEEKYLSWHHFPKRYTWEHKTDNFLRASTSKLNLRQTKMESN